MSDQARKGNSKMSSRVENALEEYRIKYFNRIGKFNLSMEDCLELRSRNDEFDILNDSFEVGFVISIRCANKMRKALK